jgi:PDZ domain-containing protein
LVALIAGASLFPVPYVVYSPGPVEDTLGEWEGEPVIEIHGAETYPTDGVLNLTTVGVTPADRKLDLLRALQAWIDPDRTVVPRELVYPEDITAEEAREENAQLLERSQESAKVATLRELEIEVPEVVVVDSVVDGAPADGVLVPGDVVISVDGAPIAEPQDVVEAVTAHEPGETVEFVVERDGARRTETVGSQAAEDDGRAIVGFSPTIGYEFPVQIDVNIDERIGGPSAGMIFALAIYDTLTPGALLAGMHVAGTGISVRTARSARSVGSSRRLRQLPRTERRCSSLPQGTATKRLSRIPVTCAWCASKLSTTPSQPSRPPRRAIPTRFPPAAPDGSLSRRRWLPTRWRCLERVPGRAQGRCRRRARECAAPRTERRRA